MGFFDWLFGKREQTALNFNGTNYEYIDMILQQEFSRYTVAEMVSMRSLCPQADFGCQPLNFLLMDDGTPVVGLVLTDKVGSESSRMKATIAACEAVKLPCLLFISGQEHPYAEVVNRIRAAMDGE